MNSSIVCQLQEEILLYLIVQDPSNTGSHFGHNILGNN